MKLHFNFLVLYFRYKALGLRLKCSQQISKYNDVVFTLLFNHEFYMLKLLYLSSIYLVATKHIKVQGCLKIGDTTQLSTTYSLPLRLLPFRLFLFFLCLCFRCVTCVVHWLGPVARVRFLTDLLMYCGESESIFKELQRQHIC